MKKITLLCLALMSTALAQAQKNPSFQTVSQNNGPSLGFSPSSGVKVISIGKYKFKDLNKNGKLDKYEDWRLPVEERAKDLASKMSLNQIAGLMLYSIHQAIPALTPNGFILSGTYDGKAFKDAGVAPSTLTDQQKKFLVQDNLRHVLLVTVQSPAVAAQWNNNVQALVEGTGLGIPANNSSDPRHGTNSGVEYNAGAGGTISQWPDEIGLAATFDPNIVKQFGHIAAQEYRALGIATALSPQIDLASEPRWVRLNGTFGEDPQLDADMARAYVDGFQTSTGNSQIKDGWGYHSVNAMIKHWPGGGPEEGGRDAHYAYGKFAVYPGNNFDEHLSPFVDGALKLKDGTKTASAVMPYYTISYNRDVYGENNGNGYSKYLVTDLLRKKYGYDGVVCSDWLITADEGKTPDVFMGKPWGNETATIAERHYKILMAGVDQFGGNNDSKPVIEAYNMGIKEHGEAFMRARFEQSAVRLLKNIFRVGLFENPYLDTAKSQQIVGNPQFMKAGYDAQVKSVVLLKNHDHLLPLQKGKTVYIPQRYRAAAFSLISGPSQAHFEEAIKPELLQKYFNATSDPSKADYAIVFVSNPNGGPGYDPQDVKNGGTGYVPISLQYSPYTAVDARAHSIAAGDPAEPTVKDRTYLGKNGAAANAQDLKIIQETKAAMQGKPVIVVITMTNPMIFSEFEKDVNAILASDGVQNQALLEILSGSKEPSGLLPVQMPKDMQTVELQNEDIPHDMICYTDADQHTYDFGFGLNWKGVINDQRNAKYTNTIAKPEIKITGNQATITCKTPKTKIYYTLDNSTPSFVSDQEYKQPITLQKGAVIKAIAKIYGVNNSVLAVYPAQ